VEEEDWRGIRVDVPIPPIQQSDHHRPQVEALLSQTVFITDRPVLVLDAFEDAVVQQCVEPGGQHITGDFQAPLKVLETTNAEEGIPEDQKRPALSDHLQGAGDGARLVVIGSSEHGPILPGLVA
jgi:hypothetical protein